VQSNFQVIILRPVRITCMPQSEGEFVLQCQVDILLLMYYQRNSMAERTPGVVVTTGIEHNGKHQETETDHCPDRSRPYVFIRIHLTKYKDKSTTDDPFS
jgi:hypothetical protein